MAEFGPQMTLTAKAAADLSSVQYHFLRWSAADTVNVSSQGAAQDFAGVLQNKPNAADRAATVAVDGETKVVAGGAITVNDFITTNGSGRAAAAGSGDMVMGRALQTAANDGEVIRMILRPQFFNGDVS